MHIEFHLPAQKKKYLVSLWQAEHLLYADHGMSVVICRLKHAELQGTLAFRHFEKTKLGESEIYPQLQYNSRVGVLLQRPTNEN